MNKEDKVMTIKDGKTYISQVRELIVEYTKRLNRDLSFQNIDEELSDPSNKYTAPNGEILVAVDDCDNVWGMVAYHRLNEKTCEMKRLFVKPEIRGLKIGDMLVQEIICHAQIAGYKEMVLDTITPLQRAIHLYTKYGFTECEAYYMNPMDDVIYMRREL